MSRVWAESRHAGGKLLVLLALADHADHDGRAFPAVDELARKSRMSERHVRRVLRELEESGEVQTDVGGYVDGRPRASTYRVVLGKGDILSEGDTHVRERGTPVSGEGDAHVPPTVIEPSLEPSGTASTPDDADDALFRMPAAVPAEQAEDERAHEDEVWDHYFQRFGHQLRVKEFTDARRRLVRKALNAVNSDGDVLKRAIDGFLAYRQRHPQGSQDTSLDALFKTRPGGSNLTDQIEFWASHADSSHAISAEVPSVLRDRIQRRRVLVAEMLSQPDNRQRQERGQEALTWLRENAHEKPEIVGGRIVGWSRIA